MSAPLSIGAAVLDPVSGLIAGCVPAARRPPVIEFLIDGRSVRRVPAAALPADLPEAARPTPDAAPEGAVYFTARLPKNAVGEDLSVREGERRLLDLKWRDEKHMRRYMEGSVMSDSVALEELTLRAGVFRARLRDHARGPQAPQVKLFALGREIVSDVSLAPEGDGEYALSATLPLDALGDGVATIQFRMEDGSVIGAYHVAAGAALAGDLVAEVGSLRAELDQLKRAFRDTFAAGALRRDERPMIVAEALAQVDHLLEMRDRMDRRQDALAASE
ncbi:MAG: hypothetical protein AAFU55_13545, partial [Pseudomonadota bacterium]